MRYQVPKLDDGTIDFAALGSQLEHDSAEDCRRFVKEWSGYVHRSIQALVWYARFSAQAKEHRARGDIDLAIIAEQNADTVYDIEISEKDKW